MKRILLTALLAGALGMPALADSPINAMCPIGKEPIVPSAGTVEYKGKSIGLCCPGCGEAFLAWGEDRRDEFVALAMRGAEPGQKLDTVESSAPALDVATSDAAAIPYPLNTCIVADSELGSMGEPVVREYDGRQVKFCCSACIGTFEADKATYFKKLDAQIIADQIPFYPTDTCIVAGGELGSMGEPVNLIYNNRLVRFCCAACEPAFNEDPAAFIKVLDKMIIEQQSRTYPLTKCVVAEAELGSMGDPVDYVFASRLVRFCCASCVEGFEADPTRYLAKLTAN